MSSYEIKSGDTLGAIAKTFGTTVKELARTNKILDPNKIRAGARIVVPEQEKTLMQQAQSFMGMEPEKKEAPVIEKKPKPVIEKKPEPIVAQKQDATPQASLLAPPKKEQPLLPTNVRQFVYDIFGGKETLTEESLKKEEISALREGVIRAKAAGKEVLEYEDYATQGEGESQYADVGGGGGFAEFFEKVFDPSYSMKTTIGQARIEEDEEGNTIVIDRYNFNDAEDKFSFMGLMTGIKKAGLSPYAQVRNIGKQLGSGQGEGSEVRINLGKIAATDIKKVEAFI
jgi:murein DD-endopeptidase MepM/ murein hydrolase activator NlpD